MSTPEIGRAIVLAGLGIAAVGLVIWIGPRIPFFGRLPGDISFERENVSVYAPLGSMLVVSLVLTIVLNIIAYLRR